MRERAADESFQAPPGNPADMAAAIAAGGTVMWCEWPSLDGGATAGGHLQAFGWAHCEAGLEEVAVLAGGQRFEPRIGLARPDVDESLPGFEGRVSGFGVVIDTRGWEPGPHVITVRVKGRGCGAVGQSGVVHVGADVPYRAWLRSRGTDAADASAPVDQAAAPLTVHVLAATGARAELDASLDDQTHSNWRLARGTLANTLSAVADGGDAAVLVEDRGALAPQALARLAAALGRAPAPDLVYADEDAMMPDGERGDAFLKPGWSPELLLSTDYVGPLVAIGPAAARAAIAAEAEPAQTLYDVLLRIVDAPLSVERIPDVLFTSQAPRAPADDPLTHDAIERLAARRGRRAHVVPVEGAGRDVRWGLDRKPLVSVIIPTSLAHGRFAECLRSLRERTTYPSLELVVVDSSSDGLASVDELLQGFSHRVVPYEGPFNFSAAVNQGARAAAGEYVLLLNDDTEVRSADWVERMLEHMFTPGVGIVGCELLYPQGSVQHAGVVLDVGGAGSWHVHWGFSPDAPGYRGMLQLTRNLSGVTGACMMVDGELFAELGGFDESFASEFSDIDLCLRSIELGRRVVWTPHAVLTHHERSSLPAHASVSDFDRFVERWSARYAEGDPLYHPAFMAMSYEFPPGGGDGEAAGSVPPMEAGTATEPFESPPRTFGELAEAISAGRMAMRCETPSLDGTATADGHLTLIGWAYSRAGVEDVFVYLDGLRYRARYGRQRQDLGTFAGDDLSRSGFELTIELDDEQAGPIEVAVVARGTDGRAVGMRGEVECRPGGAEASTAAGATAPASAAREPFAPQEKPGSLVEAEQDARYRWAAQAVRGRDVLDAGCGVGYGTGILAWAGASKAVGLDVSEHAIRAGGDRFSHMADFMPGDLLALPLEEGSFDVVVCFEAIDQVSDPERALDELRRVLRPDGLLLLSTPNFRVYPTGNPLHLHEYVPDELEEALSRRFANVRLHRQQSHVASLVCDDDAFAQRADDKDLDAHLRKLMAQHPAEELFTVAAASDAKLPELRSMALIGGLFEHRSSHDATWELRERVLIAQANAWASDADALAAQADREQTKELLALTERGLGQAQGLLESVTRSFSWRVTRPLRMGKRVLRRRRGGRA